MQKYIFLPHTIVIRFTVILSTTKNVILEKKKSKIVQIIINQKFPPTELVSRPSGAQLVEIDEESLRTSSPSLGGMGGVGGVGGVPQQLDKQTIDKRIRQTVVSMSKMVIGQFTQKN